MATNLIQNAAFSQGLTNWLQYTWYPDNTVCALSSGGHNGACVKLTVRSIGDPGQSYIYQPVHLTGGESYTLSFYAKRTGNVDIWAQVSSAHGTHYSPSFIPTLSQDGAYTKLSFSFTADGNSGDTVSTTIRLIAGSAGGDAWFDTVELVADSDDGTNDDIDVGDVIITILPGVNFRSTPAGASLFQVVTGTTMTVIEIITNGGYSWYKGLISGSTGYIRGDCVEKYSGGSGGGDSYTVDKFGATNTAAVFVRKSAGGIAYSTTEKLRLGSTFLIAGTTGSGSNTWVKIRYGTATGGTTDAYISATYFDELASTTPSTAKERCLQIAKSLEGVHETVLGLSGECCQQFIYWLCGSCGKTVNDMPYGEDICGDARDYFKENNKGTWHPLNEGYVPQPGDLVYYTSSTAGASSHVGLVTGNGSNSFATTGYTSVECNLSNRVRACKGNYQTGECDNGKTVQGFATPLWT